MTTTHAQTNWAGSLTYGATAVHRPTSAEELRSVVAGAHRVRALGSRHSFSTVADTDGQLVSLAAMPPTVEPDTAGRRVRVAGGVTYAHLAAVLQAGGLALPAMASLPHISVAGAVATGTHGSGDAFGGLAADVVEVEMLSPAGDTVVLRRDDAATGEDFPGAVVALGALGVVTHLVLQVEPTYDVAQHVYVDVPWDVVGDRDALDALMASADSVSLFTRLVDPTAGHAVLKARTGTVPTPVPGARPATTTVHPLSGGDPAAVTEQGGVPGPWHERLPHFRAELTPSRGAEVQSEYLVPRENAVAAIAAVRSLAPGLAHLVQVCEVRSVAADDLWLSPAHGADVIGLHTTWVRDVDAVRAALGPVEEALLPLGARPHWGKVTAGPPRDLRAAYPLLPRFAALRDRLDPDHVFTNAFVDDVLG